MEMYATEEGRLILVYGIQYMSDLLVNLWVKHEWEHWNSIPDVVQNELISTYELSWHVQNHGLNETLEYTLEQKHLHWIWICEFIHPSWILITNYVLIDGQVRCVIPYDRCTLGKEGNTLKWWIDRRTQKTPIEVDGWTNSRRDGQTVTIVL